MPTINYQDDYKIRYEVDYEYKSTPNGEVLDITTKIYDPRVYGEEPTGYILNRKTYIKGQISITRQVIRQEDDGYTIIAEGGTQQVTEDKNQYIQVDGLFFDNLFKYGLNYSVVADEEGSVDDGSAFVDIYDTSNSCIWGIVDGAGSIVPSADNILTFIDVW